MNDSALQNRATAIIKPLVPPDAEERVNRAFKQWNQVVREHIRNETGLRLSDGGNRFTIPVRVAEGFPLKLAQLIDQYRDPVMWRLIVGHPKLVGLIEGLKFLLHDWNQFEKWPSLPELAKNGKAVLEQALAITSSLQSAALAEKVMKEIKDIHEDILGLYQFSQGQGTVELYWLPIALAASILDVAIEDLTVLALIHELAHGYTHVGRDIDGDCWEDSGFDGSDLAVVEGLAQFYTEVISERLAVRMPNLFTAYQALLTLQSGPYVVHRDWNADGHLQIGEAVRFALLAARSKGIVSHDEWMARMAEAHYTLLRDPPPDERLLWTQQ